FACHRLIFFFFFFQAEDGIRDFHVTGVQTCALPIWRPALRAFELHLGGGIALAAQPHEVSEHFKRSELGRLKGPVESLSVGIEVDRKSVRVGKECRSGWSRDEYKKNRV